MKGYGTQGKRLYRCDECKRGTFFSKREENRAARLKCSGCGSSRLVLSANGADKLIEELDRVRGK